MRGNIDLGLSFTQSNGQQGLTLQSSLAYQSKKYEASLNTSYQFISQQETENTSELTVKSAFFRQLRKSEWYGGAIANFLSSSEQRIALQSTLGAALTRRIVFTNRTNLSAVGGLLFQNELLRQSARCRCTIQQPRSDLLHRLVISLTRHPPAPIRQSSQQTRIGRSRSEQTHLPWPFASRC